MTDYYQTLGVAKTATPEEIKKAYRKLAAKYHPDREGGDTAKFQQIEEAYRNLSDPQLRAQHDNPNPFGGQGGSGFPGGFSFNFGGNPFEDIFSQFARQQQQRIYTVSLWVTLEQVARGTEETVQFNTPQGMKTFKIAVPKSVEDGQQIRYEGLMPDGLLQIQFRVHGHPVFERRGIDLYVTKKISVFDLILGTTVKVPTIYGDSLEVTIPPRTKPESTLRIQGRGLEQRGRLGDQYLLISAIMPDTISEELLLLIKEETKRNPINPQ
jgi:curved DNA-binding protein